MRNLEITLKICFTVLAAALILSRQLIDLNLLAFLTVSFGLGIVLILNKKPSYKRARAKSDFAMRRIEGMLLVIFAVAGTWMIALNS